MYSPTKCAAAADDEAAPPSVAAPTSGGAHTVNMWRCVLSRSGLKVTVGPACHTSTGKKDIQSKPDVKKKKVFPKFLEDGVSGNTLAIQEIHTKFL